MDALTHHQHLLIYLSTTRVIIVARQLHDFADQWLTERDFKAYTPWDYAKDGAESRYKKLLLEGCERIGIGYHSRSWLDSVMWETGHSLQEYIDHPDDFQTTAVHIANRNREQAVEIFHSEMSCCYR